MTDLEADLKIAQARIKELEAQLAAADVVKVVRCKDCQCWQENPWSDSGEMVCKRWVDWLPTEADDFCSYGERRADNAAD